MKKLYVSDCHFGHQNIILYEHRPFESVEEMDKAMIEKWNKKVEKGDVVYILGDFAFGDKEYIASILRKLNGNKILILGNHDLTIKRNRNFFKQYFAQIVDYCEIYDGNTFVTMSHYPMLTWNKAHHGSVNLAGHCHSMLHQDNPENVTLFKDNQYNVGADVIDFEPCTLQEIIQKKQTWKEKIVKKIKGV